MTPAPITTHGNRRPWQHRPSADRLGNAPWVYGRLLPMPKPRRGWLAIFRRTR